MTTWIILLWKLTATKLQANALYYILAKFVCILHKQPKRDFCFSQSCVHWSGFLWNIKISKRIHKQTNQTKGNKFVQACTVLSMLTCHLQKNIKNTIKSIYTSNVLKSEAVGRVQNYLTPGYRIFILPTSVSLFLC